MQVNNLTRLVNTLIDLFGERYVRQLDLVPEIQTSIDKKEFSFVKSKKNDIHITLEESIRRKGLIHRVHLILFCPKIYCLKKTFNFEVKGLIYERIGFCKMDYEKWDYGVNQMNFQKSIECLKRNQNLLIIPKIKIYSNPETNDEYNLVDYTCPLCDFEHKKESVYYLPEETIFCSKCETDFIKTLDIDKKTKLSYYLVKKNYGI